MGRGICNRPVQPKQEEPKSIGHSMTLPQDIGVRTEIEAYLLKLSEMVGRRARRHWYLGKTVSLVITYADFETFSRQSRCADCTNNTLDIYQNALHILDAVRPKEKVRLLGICLSDLTADPSQILLMT